MLPFTPNGITDSSWVVAIDGVTQRPYTDFRITSTSIQIMGVSNVGDVITVQNFGISSDILTDNTVIAGDLTISGETITNSKSTGSTTLRSLQERFAEVVNVKDFGATGDGTTDDRAAIQAAIDHSYVGGAATATITITNYANLEAEDKVTLKATAAPSVGIDFTAKSSGTAAQTWIPETSNAQTAINLTASINAHASFTAAVVGAVVTVTQVGYGSAGNTAVALVDASAAGMSKTDFLLGGAAGSGTVYFPDGTYLIKKDSTSSFGLNINPTGTAKISLVGASRDAVLDGGTGFLTGNELQGIPMINIEDASYVNISSLTLKGNSVVGTNGNGHAIKAWDNAAVQPQHLHLEDLHIVGFAGFDKDYAGVTNMGDGGTTSFPACGVYVGGGLANYIEEVVFEDCAVSIMLDNTQNSVIERCVIDDPVTYGVWLRGTDDVCTVRDCQIQNVTSATASLTYSSIAVPLAGLFIKSTTGPVNIVGCKLKNSPTQIAAFACQVVTIDGCIIKPKHNADSADLGIGSGIYIYECEKTNIERNQILYISSAESVAYKYRGIYYQDSTASIDHTHHSLRNNHFRHPGAHTGGDTTVVYDVNFKLGGGSTISDGSLDIKGNKFGGKVTNSRVTACIWLNTGVGSSTRETFSGSIVDNFFYAGSGSVITSPILLQAGVILQSGTISRNKQSVDTAGTDGVFTNQWYDILTDSEVSVKDFGARGNGEEDDTVAIQAALNTGLTVFIPAGVYKITATLKPLDNQKVYGEGYETIIRSISTSFDVQVAGTGPATPSTPRTTLDQINATQNTVRMTSPLIWLNGRTNTTVSGLKLEKVYDSNGHPKDNLLILTECNRCFVEKIWGGGYEVLKNDSGSRFRFIYLVDCDFCEVTECTFNGCALSGATPTAVASGGSAGVSDFLSNPYTLDGCVGCRIANSYAEFTGFPYVILTAFQGDLVGAPGDNTTDSHSIRTDPEASSAGTLAASHGNVIESCVSYVHDGPSFDINTALGNTITSCSSSIKTNRYDSSLTDAPAFQLKTSGADSGEQYTGTRVNKFVNCSAWNEAVGFLAQDADGGIISSCTFDYIYERHPGSGSAGLVGGDALWIAGDNFRVSDCQLNNFNSTGIKLGSTPSRDGTRNGFSNISMQYASNTAKAIVLEGASNKNSFSNIMMWPEDTSVTPIAQITIPSASTSNVFDSTCRFASSTGGTVAMISDSSTTTRYPANFKTDVIDLTDAIGTDAYAGLLKAGMRVAKVTFVCTETVVSTTDPQIMCGWIGEGTDDLNGIVVAVDIPDNLAVTPTVIGDRVALTPAQYLIDVGRIPSVTIVNQVATSAGKGYVLFEGFEL